ncbi:TRAP transporter substrate-binding protein [Marinomonas mediterranea]|uniref:Extracellular solute-binding protein, family 7 n=1 Tax=Marinomonas mediterranea (strain ATCC 700492 / JCM 21426 / NBRC 103028 / MMB-1) TaxID=717774 RepID=F2JXM5_MARM1|nr:TRAP transporter substrate-binding protein [Marinomonas mediterranea]ADZ93023.1 Extracellular solute-binding protein, family 7 [Marinomonas mediterranea MMB-1]WCN10933.1 C4-dicarboxylate ABC transporter substrate-binding protein [Marinomonas mediterranea]WCN14995.1 C4-dicarboxylate ABC transporter substrate-binding protein [Marinomonas mediterranea]WCN19039.1 C4-dicarboxylate ABC transporter substrate-binding protein [Marinomonas mediterranea MMB-1]
MLSFISKKNLAILAISTAVFSTSSAVSAADAKYKWTFQSGAQAGDSFFAIQQEWAKRVGVMSQGEIDIDLVPVNSVVAYNETLDAVGVGILQGHIADPSYFSGKDPAFAMLGNLVGAWSSPYQMFGFMEYGGGKEVYNQLVNPYGLQFIGAASTGVESFVSKTPIRSVEDFKGIKMRAPEGMVQEVFASINAAPVNLPGSEVYTALDKGVIDAADYSVFSTNQAQGLHKFAKYPLFPGFHSMPTLAVSMNKNIWDGLSPSLKEVLSVSVREFGYDMVQRLEMLDKQAVVEAKKDSSIEIINWPEEERAKFRGIAQKQWKKWAERSPMAKEVYTKVSAYLVSQDLLAK